MITPSEFLKYLEIFNVNYGNSGTGSVTKYEVQQSAFNYAVDSGATGAAYIATLSPAPVAYTDGLLITLYPSHTSTVNNPTINVNGLGAKQIVGPSNSPLPVQAIELGINAQLMYVESIDSFILLNPSVFATELSPANIFVGSLLGIAQGVPVSGDASLDETGEMIVSSTNGTPFSDFALIQSIQNSSYVYGVDTGAANAYVLTLSPALTAYADGQAFIMHAVNANTGASTINVNGLGAIPIVNIDGTALIGQNILAGSNYYLVVNGGGTEAILLNPNLLSVSAQKFYVGTTRDPYTFVITSDGATITATVQNNPTGDITCYFSTGIYTLDATPALTITLTAGTDTTPIKNYVYVLESTKALTVSTTGWPSAEHLPIGTAICQSAASVQTQGAYSVQLWSQDVFAGTNNNGHLNDLNYWIRQQPATWQSGVALTPTTGAAQFDIATSSGVVLQLHPHTFPAFNTGTGSFVLVPNYFGASYTQVNNLTSIVADANNGSLTNTYYNLVIWGVVSEATGDCHLMVNLPTGSYTVEASAINDVDSTSVYNIPSSFTNSGFLIARLTVRNQANTTWSISNNEDLRGLLPATATGSGVGGISALIDDPNPTLGGNLQMNGHSIVAPSSTISDFITSTSLSGAADTTGATSLAIKTYVDAQRQLFTAINFLLIGA